MVRRFLDANARASRRLDRVLNPEHGELERTFHETVRREMRDLAENATVIDLGGGQHCNFVKYLPKDRELRIVAVDISAEELAKNKEVTEVRVANVCEELPFPDGEASLVLSRCLLEHVDNVPEAVRHMSRVLAPGGSTLHYLPCRFSTFGTAARLLPFGPLLRLLHWVTPETKGWVEFDVYYDHCYPAALERAFHEAGFRQVDVRVEYVSTEFFFSFLPAFVLVAMYERILKKLDARSLAAHIMVHAQR